MLFMNKLIEFYPYANNDKIMLKYRLLINYYF